MIRRRLVIIISLLPIVILSAVSFHVLYNAHSLGIAYFYDEGINQYRVLSTEDWSPLKKGDVIKKIGDVRIGYYHLLKYPDYIPEREEFFEWFEIKERLFHELKKNEVILLIERDGREINIMVSPQKTGLSFINHSYIYNIADPLLICSVFMIDLIVLSKKGITEESIVFFLLTMFVSLSLFPDICLNLSEITLHPFIIRLMYPFDVLCVSLEFALAIHLTLLIPAKRPHIKQFRRLIYTAALASGLLYYMHIITFSYMSMVGVAAAAVSLIHAFFYYKEPIQKQQIKWAGAAFLTPLFFPIILKEIPFLITGEEFTQFDMIIILTNLSFPLFLSFAIMKYRLMDIDSLFDSTIIYTITLGILAIGDMWLITSLDKLKSEHLKMSEPLNTFIAVAFIISVYIPIRNRVRNIVKRLLKREVYDMNEMSLKMSNYFIAETEIPVVIKKTMELITKCLHPRGGGIVMYWEKNSFSSPLPLWERIEERAIPEQLIHESKTLTTPKQIFEMPIAKEIPKDYDNGVIIPIIGSLGTIGAIILKNKHSDKLYSTEDINLLIMIAGQTATAIEIIKAKQGEKKKEEEIRQERERISREIHDGIGTAFTNAIVMTEMIDSPLSLPSPTRGEGKIVEGEGNGNSIENLRTLLTEGLTELRELIWAVEDKDHTLLDIASHIKDKAEQLLTMNNIKHNVNIEIGLPPPSPPLRPLNPLLHKEGKGVVDKKVYAISPKKKLNMVRLMQEALGNIIKHADATEVDINIKEKDGRITMEIKDNGNGFDSTIIQSKGYGLRNMKNRCDEMGAEFKIHSEIGKGTEIVVEMGV